MLSEAKHLLVSRYGGTYGGLLAYVIQRLTGVALLAYLFLHVHTVAQLSKGPAAFNRALSEFANPFFHVLEIGLLGTVILHALNGIRIMLLDAGVGFKRQREYFWIGVVGVGTLLFLAGAIPIFLASVLGWSS